MNIDDFLTANPGISREQVEEADASEETASLFDAKAGECGLEWFQDSSGYAYMRATRTLV